MLRSVVQLEPNGGQKSLEGVANNSSGMLYFLRIGFPSKMQGVLTPSDGHEIFLGRHRERRAVRSSQVKLLTLMQRQES